jgi:hypothetical protein
MVERPFRAFSEQIRLLFRQQRGSCDGQVSTIITDGEEPVLARELQIKDADSACMGPVLSFFLDKNP